MRPGRSGDNGSGTTDGDSALGDGDDTGDDTGDAADAVEPDTDGDAADGGGGDAGGSTLGKAPCESDENCIGSGTGKRCDLGPHVCVDCLAQSDCAAGERCEAKVCVPAVACKSDVDCKATAQVCDKDAGSCVACNIDADCDAATCVEHQCVKKIPCKSSKECPAVCDAVSGFCAQCTSSDDCAGKEFCLQGSCVADLCDGPACAGGKSFACAADGSGFKVGASCDDDDLCTEGDTCEGGLCKPGPTKACDDGKPCTFDSCDPKAGCIAGPSEAPCDDGDPCTIDDACKDGSCKGAPKNCDDLEPCTTDACEPGGACAYKGVTGPCSDGDACTKDDACANGKCKPGSATNCNDDNPCTTDSCGKADGCKWVALEGPCNDGSDCTTGDVCTKGKCVGVGKQCVDDNACTDDSCVVGECFFTNNSKGCDDGDPCSADDACSGGACKGTPIGGAGGKGCNDGNPCTTDSCNKSGCGFLPNTLPCDDTDACTENDTCAEGYCIGKKKACDDGNPCTLDSCDSKSGCVATKTSGTSCGDANSCAVCVEGVCKGGTSTTYEKTFGGGGADAFLGLLPRKDGSAFLFGRKVTTATMGWLARIDDKGFLSWEKTFGQASQTNGFEAGVDDGNDEITLVGQRGYDAWIAHFDVNGGLLWEAMPGSSGATDNAHSLVANPKGYALCGSQTVSSGSSSYKYGWVVQVDGKGATQWSKQIAGISDCTGVTMVGETLALSGVGVGSKGGIDLKVKVIEPGGNEIWAVDLGYNTTDNATGILGLTGGDLLVYGSVYVNNAYRPSATRLTNKGVVKWEVPIGTQAGEFWTASEFKGELVLAGFAITGNQRDGMIASVSAADGTVAWTRVAAYSKYYDDRFYGVAPLGDQLLVAGQAYFGGNLSYEGWMVRVNGDGRLACECTDGFTDNNACTTDVCYLGKGIATPVSQTGGACTTGEGQPGTCSSGGVCTLSCGNKYCGVGENYLNCPADCKPPSQHPCNTSCGQKNSTYGCWCDSTCKSKGDCCTSSGAKGFSCSGSTCNSCQ